MTKEELIDLIVKQDADKFRTKNFNKEKAIRLVELLDPNIPIPQWGLKMLGDHTTIGLGGPPDEIIQELTWKNDQCLVQITIPGYVDSDCSVRFEYHGGISQYSFQDETELINYVSRLLRAKFELS